MANGPIFRSLLHLDPKHLRQLVAVADRGSIRGASRVLAITQPALSRSIRMLEDDLGAQLVERGPRGVTLTDVGRTLVKYARIIEANLSLAAREIQDVQRRTVTQIAFGMSWLAEYAIADQLIGDIVEQRPSLRVSLLTGDYESLAPRLLSGELEFILGPPPVQQRPPGVSSELLMSFKAAVLVRATHPLAQLEHVSFRDLAEASWVLPLAGTAPRITYNNFFLRHGVEPPAPLVALQPLSGVIRGLVLEHDLATLLPLTVVEREVAEGLLKVLPFEDEIQFPIHLIKRDLGHPSEAWEYVVDQVRRICAGLTHGQASRALPSLTR